MSPPPCEQCGGPHEFDTSVANQTWNEVVRGQGLPDYLCLTCILKAFKAVDRPLVAQLYGGPFNGDPLVYSGRTAK